MWGYERRLSRDVARWQSAGWITPDAGERILADVAAGGSRMALAPVLAILASVLMAFAVISFVAAHWDEMPRALRLGLLFGGLWTSYGLAGWFQSRGMKGFSDAALLLAVAIFGGSIMLISQMFHIDANPPDGILLWWTGALAAGVLLASNPALALTMVLVGLWAYLETDQRSQVYWPFLVGWALVSAAFAWQRWRPGLHLSGLALALFVVSLGFTLKTGHEHGTVLLLGLAASAGGFIAERLKPGWASLWRGVLQYGALTAFAALMALQFIEPTGVRELIFLAVITLALLLGLVWLGLWSDNRAALWLGYIAFSIEIFSLYVKTVGSLLDTSLFFLIAALLVAALAGLAWRLHMRADAREAVS
jgi:uncharacterized membrane protein